MNWGTCCLHQSLDIHLIPVGIPLVQTPYGLAVQSPAHCNSIAYLRKGDIIVQRPDSLSSVYSFEDWIAPTSAGANLWSFNSENSSTALLGAVMDTGAQHGATGARTEILQKTGHTLTMQPAVGPSKRMTGILMGTETVDQHGVPYVLIIPDVSVFDPGMSDSLVSAAVGKTTVL